MENNPSIEEMNHTIFDFMGCVHSKHADIDAFEMKNLNYHKSWGALMPVVEKISRIKLLNADGTECTNICEVCYPITFNMPDPEGRPMFRFLGFSLHTGDTLIEAAHAAVYEVAEHQNKKKNDGK